MSEPSRGGVIAWMVRNGVTPNLMMIVCLIGGFALAWQIKKEVFPEFDEDQVTITVPYPGASPEEVERGIVLAVELISNGIGAVAYGLALRDRS